jgi:hypothetical protein
LPGEVEWSVEDVAGGPFRAIEAELVDDEQAELGVEANAVMDRLVR